jgi:hypothetical protein
LNNLQHLLALDYSVAVGVKNLYLSAEFESSFLGGRRLLSLVTVIVRKGNNEEQLFQELKPSWENRINYTGDVCDVEEPVKHIRVSAEKRLSSFPVLPAAS